MSDWVFFKLKIRFECFSTYFREESFSEMCLYGRILHPTSEELSFDVYNVKVVRK